MHEGFEAGKTFLRRYDAKAEYVLRHDEFAECRRAYLSAWRGTGDGGAGDGRAAAAVDARIRAARRTRVAERPFLSGSLQGAFEGHCWYHTDVRGFTVRCTSECHTPRARFRPLSDAGEPLEAAEFPSDLAPLDAADRTTAHAAGGSARAEPQPPALLGGRPVRLWWRRDAYQRVKVWVDAEFDSE